MPHRYGVLTRSSRHKVFPLAPCPMLLRVSFISETNKNRIQNLPSYLIRNP
jgi:hypothetical protein